MSQYSPSKENQNNRVSLLIPISIIFSFTLVLCLFLEAHISGLSLRDLIIQFKSSLYFPHHNSLIVGQIGKVNVLKLFYTFLLSAILVMSAYYYFIRAKTNKQIPLLESITTVGIIGLLLFAGIQQVHRFEHFKSEKNVFADKTVEEKLLALFGKKYHFAQICQELLPGHHYGELITDLDVSKSPYMFHQRILSYHLYPKVSLRFKKHLPKDCLILYHKKNPLKYIPKDYKILFANKDNNYILASNSPSVK